MKFTEEEKQIIISNYENKKAQYKEAKIKYNELKTYEYNKEYLKTEKMQEKIICECCNKEMFKTYYISYHIKSSMYNLYLKKKEEGEKYEYINPKDKIICECCNKEMNKKYFLNIHSKTYKYNRNKINHENQL